MQHLVGRWLTDHLCCQKRCVCKWFWVFLWNEELASPLNIFDLVPVTALFIYLFINIWFKSITQTLKFNRHNLMIMYFNAPIQIKAFIKRKFLCYLLKLLELLLFFLLLFMCGYSCFPCAHGLSVNFVYRLCCMHVGVWCEDVRHAVGDEDESSEHRAVLPRVSQQQPAGRRTLSLHCRGTAKWKYILIIP